MSMLYLRMTRCLDHLAVCLYWKKFQKIVKRQCVSSLLLPKKKPQKTKLTEIIKCMKRPILDNLCETYLWEECACVVSDHSKLALLRNQVDIIYSCMVKTLLN